MRAIASPASSVSFFASPELRRANTSKLLLLVTHRAFVRLLGELLPRTPLFSFDLDDVGHLHRRARSRAYAYIYELLLLPWRCCFCVVALFDTRYKTNEGELLSLPPVGALSSSCPSMFIIVARLYSVVNGQIQFVRFSSSTLLFA